MDARTAYKPDFVPNRFPRRWMTIPLPCPLPDRSSCQPEPSEPKQLWTRAPARFLFGIAPGGACRAVLVAKDAVRSYRTVSPLPRNACGAVCFLWRFPSGFPGRALPGTVVLWSPDFPLGWVPPPKRPSSHPRICDLGGSHRLVNGEAGGKVICHRHVQLIRPPCGPCCPRPVSQTKSRKQGFLVTICGHSGGFQHIH